MGATAAPPRLERWKPSNPNLFLGGLLFECSPISIWKRCPVVVDGGPFPGGVKNGHGFDRRSGCYLELL